MSTKLFERDRTGVRLTAAGRQFLKEAQIGAGHFRRAVRAAAEVGQGHDGELRIGLLTSLAKGSLAEVTARFRERHPRIHVRIEEGSSQENIAGVLNGRLDIAFVSGEPRLPGVQTTFLWLERVLVALPAKHQLATRETIAWNEVWNETVPGPPPGLTPSAPGGTGPGPTPPRGPSPPLAGPVAAIQSSRQDSP